MLRALLIAWGWLMTVVVIRPARAFTSSRTPPVDIEEFRSMVDQYSADVARQSDQLSRPDSSTATSPERT